MTFIPILQSIAYLKYTFRQKRGGQLLMTDIGGRMVFQIMIMTIILMTLMTAVTMMMLAVLGIFFRIPTGDISLLADRLTYFF